MCGGNSHGPPTGGLRIGGTAWDTLDSELEEPAMDCTGKSGTRGRGDSTSTGYFPRHHASMPSRFPSASQTPSASAGARKSVLLLPLQLMQKQPGLTAQAEGILESLSSRLSQFRSLQIETLPLENSTTEKDSPQDLARQFGSQAYLTGSLDEVKGKLEARIILQDTASGKIIWSHRFSAVPQDVFAMQDEIYTKLLLALNVKPSADELALGASRPTENVNAYDLYLRGRSGLRNQRSEQALHSSIDLYNQALKSIPRLGWPSRVLPTRTLIFTS